MRLVYRRFKITIHNNKPLKHLVQLLPLYIPLIKKQETSF